MKKQRVVISGIVLLFGLGFFMASQSAADERRVLGKKQVRVNGDTQRGVVAPIDRKIVGPTDHKIVGPSDHRIVGPTDIKGSRFHKRETRNGQKRLDGI